MKLVITVDLDPPVSFEIGFEELHSIAMGLRDSPENLKLFSVLARHPSRSIRETIAGKDSLDAETVEVLLADPCPAVVRALMRSKMAHEIVTTEQLARIIERDAETAERVARDVDSFRAASLLKLCSALEKHPDPEVRQSLASNYNASRSVLKRLLKDSDASVRHAASRSFF